MTQETNEAFDEEFNKSNEESEDAQLEEEEQAAAPKPEVRKNLVPKKIEKLKPQQKPTAKPQSAKQEEIVQERYEVVTRTPFLGIRDTLTGEAVDMASPEGLAYTLAQIRNQLEKIMISAGYN